MSTRLPKRDFITISLYKTVKEVDKIDKIGDSVLLYHGDCLEEMNKIPDASVDMVLCDLPYGTTACKWDAVIPFAPLWGQYNRILKENGTVALFCAQPFTSELVHSNIKGFKYPLYWVKPQGTDPLMSRFRPMNNVDEVAIFYNGKNTYNPQMGRGKPYKVVRDKKDRINETTFMKKFTETTTVNKGDRLPLRTMYFNQERGFHPTQKPVALLEYLIRTYTNDGETILDNCMGSGSTGVACVNTGRKFIGIELDREYYKIAEKRIGAASGTKQIGMLDAI